MSAIQSLKEAILGSDAADEYHYQCKACGAQFTASDPTVETVSCPRCGAHNVGERISTE